MASPLSAGMTIELTIDALATGGKAVARLPECVPTSSPSPTADDDTEAMAGAGGMVVFVDRGLPGQTVRVTLTKVKKRFAEATLDAVLTPAPGEVPPFCRHFGVCGGCLWQTLPYPEQLAWKRRFVEDSLRRIAGVCDVETAPTIASPAQAAYRNKMEFAFLQGRGEMHLGLRRLASHSVVNITECHLQSETATAIVQYVRQWANAHPTLRAYDPRSGKGFLRFLVIRETRRTGQRTVQIITSPDPHAGGGGNAAVAALGEDLLRQFPGLHGIIHSTRTASSQVAYGEHDILVLGTAELTERLTLGNREAELSIGGPDVFFQVNTEAAERLYATVLGMAAPTGTEIVWDLYCGVGAIALGAAPRSRRVVGFELSEPAVATATANAERLSASNAVFHAGDVRQTMAKERETPHILITDPPRGGMHPDVVAAIIQHAPQRIVHVSCDPATQARDIALMLPAYTVRRIQPVDMFPHTPHVESVVLLERRS